MPSIQRRQLAATNGPAQYWSNYRKFWTTMRQAGPFQPRSDRVHKVLAYAKRNLKNALSVEELAEVARLSPRQFSRIFTEETGQSPAKAVETLRLEAARTMLEDGRHSLDVVARETGFADRERMRRAFLRVFGQPPTVIKRNVRFSGASHAAL